LEGAKMMDDNRFKIWMNFWKYAIGILCGTVLTAFLGYLINQRELDLKQIEQDTNLQVKEQENLSNYFKYTMEGNVYDRLKLTNFFSRVLDDSASRNRWRRYQDLIQSQLEEYVSVKFKLDSINSIFTGKDTIKGFDYTYTYTYAILEEKMKRLDKMLNPVYLAEWKSTDASLKQIGTEVQEEIVPIIKLELERFSHSTNATVGGLYDVSNGRKFLCFVLEDGPRATKVPGETRIPAGEYEITLMSEGGHHSRYAQKFADFHKGMLWIRNVPDFKNILIHIGNTHNDTQGSLLVGSQLINEPGDEKVISSTVAYKKIYPPIAQAIVEGKKVTITIVDNDTQ
jgi:hypothetical protein